MSTATGLVLLLIIIALMLGTFGVRISKSGDALYGILSENLRGALGKETTCTQGAYAGYTKGSFAEDFLKIKANDQADKLLTLYSGLVTCFGAREELWTPGFMGGQKVEPMKMVLESASVSLKRPITLANAAEIKALAERFQKVLSPEQFGPYANVLSQAEQYLQCKQELSTIDALLSSNKVADLAKAYVLFRLKIGSTFEEVTSEYACGHLIIAESEQWERVINQRIKDLSGTQRLPFNRALCALEAQTEDTSLALKANDLMIENQIPCPEYPQ